VIWLVTAVTLPPAPVKPETGTVKTASVAEADGKSASPRDIPTANDTTTAQRQIICPHFAQRWMMFIISAKIRNLTSIFKGESTL
jgi:hypothetical protein